MVVDGIVGPWFLAIWGIRRGMVLAGGCGDTNGKPQIDKTGYLQETYEFGKIFIRNDIAGSRSDGCRQWTEKCINMNL